MEHEYLDLVDTMERLRKISKKLNISKIVGGDASQIEIISEIKERIDEIEIERISAIDLGIIPYEA
jgi:hypothetical protein